MNKHYTINIGRELGCGGCEISKLIASNLGIECYDKKLITLAAKRVGIRKEVLENIDEKNKGFWSWITSSSSIFSFGDCYASPNYNVSDASLYNVQSDVIREIANRESCIFLGRCSDYILRHNENNINIFIYADDDFKLKEIENRRDGKMKDLLSDLKKIEKKRAEYYNFYTGQVWGDKANYDLCINSSLLGIKATADFLYNYIQKRIEIFK